MPDVIIRQAKKEDITPFMKMCAQVFKATYTNKELGIPPENFNYDLFMSAFNREYFEDLFSGLQSTAFVAVINNLIVGGIGLQLIKNDYHVGAFYVSTKHQGAGIGSKLWTKAETVMGNNTVKLEVIELATVATKMYFSKGFVIDIKNPYVQFRPIWLPNHTYKMFNLIRAGSFKANPDA